MTRLIRMSPSPSPADLVTKLAAASDSEPLGAGPMARAAAAAASPGAAAPGGIASQRPGPGPIRVPSPRVPGHPGRDSVTRVYRPLTVTVTAVTRTL